MKNRLIVSALLLITVLMLGFGGCRAEKKKTEIARQIAVVERGDLVLTVTADGNLVMPREAKLRFGTPGTVKEVFVEEGQKVKEGALLAKLDDTTHKLAVASAQYNVELAMNELVEKIHPALMGYPKLYPDTSSILRVEQAQEELGQVQKFLSQGEYKEAAYELRLARHDLEASYKMFNIPEITMSLQGYDELLGTPVENYPDISRAIKLLEQDLARLAEIQTLIEQGRYENAMTKLDTAQSRLKETHLLVKSLSGRIRVSQRIGECCQQLATQGSRAGATGLMTLPYPDTSTALSWLTQVEENLQALQTCKEEENCDELELATLLRMAQHDVEMSRAILENDELIFRSGVNLKALRAYNLNLQLAQKELERAKKELMKTEILAPFDGTVVKVGVKEADQLSSFDYSTVTAVHLVDTSTVKLDGMVDEIDIFKVKVGQKAIITIDAMPDKEFSGRVTFISPFGTQLAGVVEFAVTIALDPTDIELKGGLTATADIIVAERNNVLLIPKDTILETPMGTFVLVIKDETTKEPERRQVELGIRNYQFAEVISGLNEGEKVLIIPVGEQAKQRPGR